MVTEMEEMEYDQNQKKTSQEKKTKLVSPMNTEAKIFKELLVS